MNISSEKLKIGENKFAITRTIEYVPKAVGEYNFAITIVVNVEIS